jgi:glycine cleavage system H protein
MSQIPADLKYVDTHEWIRVEGDGTVTVGITDHAQSLLGDVVYVEHPEVDAELELGEEAGVVESVKAASDIYMPISGTIVEVNDLLEDAPETVNADPYHDGWFFKIKPSNEEELEQLLDADAYREKCEAED